MKQLKYLLGALAILSGFAGKPVISADSETQAQEAFVEGTKLYNQEKYEEAAAKFVEADRLYPNWKLQFNIGQSYAAARKYGLAVEAFEKYLALGGDEIPEERERVVIDEINNLHMKTGLLEVRGTDGTVLMIDGVRRGILPLPGKIRVSAGIIHQIAGVRDGVTIFEREIRLGVGEQAEIQIGNDAEDAPSQVAKPVIGSSEEPSSSANEDASNSPVLEKPSRTLKNAGIVSLAMGGAALVVGGITGGVAMKKNDELKSDCGDDGVCDSTQTDKVDSVDSLATASTVLFAVGAAAVITGTVLLLVHKKKNEEHALRLAPVLGTTFGIQGRF